MRNNKEQVRAHNFVVRRLVNAVVTGYPDAWEPPLRRSSIATVVGFVVAVVLVLGFLVYGFLRPAKGPPLRTGTTLVVEKETGTRYVVDDGILRPVPNLASALLAVGPKLEIQTLSRARTSLLPRGVPVGIPGAPDDVPPVAGLVSTGWSACVGATTASSGVKPPLRLAFGGDLPQPLATGEGLVVAAPDGAVYLVVGGTRHGFASAEVRTVLGYAATAPIRVPDPWLAALRPGRSLRLLTVEGLGAAGPAVDGRSTRVGEVLAVRSTSGETQYLLVSGQGIVPVTKTEQQLLLGNPELAGVNGAGGPRVVSGAAVSGVVRRPIPESQGWPAEPPRPAVSEQMDVCVSGGASGVLRAGLRATRDVEVEPAEVVVSAPPGAGAVVEATDSTGGAVAARHFVDDLGRRFAVRSEETAAALGWSGVRPLPVPSALVAIIPAGPPLDVAAVRGTGRSGDTESGNPVPAAASGGGA